MRFIAFNNYIFLIEHTKATLLKIQIFVYLENNKSNFNVPCTIYFEIKRGKKWKYFLNGKLYKCDIGLKYKKWP